MKGFALKDGDVVIQNNEIQMVSGAELTQQTIETVIATQKNEWFLNDNEGINHENIFGKKQYAIPTTDTDSKYYAELKSKSALLEKQSYEEQLLNEKLQKRLDGES